MMSDSARSSSLFESPKQQHEPEYRHAFPIPRRRLIRLVLLVCLPIVFLLWISITLVYTAQSISIINSEHKHSITSARRASSLEWSQSLSWSVVMNSRLKDAPYLRRLQANAVSGHSHSELEALLNSSPPAPNNTPNLTAVIHVTDTNFIKDQLNAVLSQSLKVNEITLICSSALYDTARYHAQKHKQGIRVLVHDPPPSEYPPASAGQSSWLQAIRGMIEGGGDWIWVIDTGALPGPHYLRYVYDLMQTDEYKDALLGMHGCHHRQVPNDRALVVDALQGAWLFRKSWLSHLTKPPLDALSAPIGHYVSNALLYYANIPSILLPTHPNTDYHLTLPDYSDCPATTTALIQQQQQQRSSSVLFIVDGPDQAVVLHPLFCRFNSNRVVVHVAVTGKQRGLAGTTLANALAQINCQQVRVHDLDAIQTTAASLADLGVMRLLQALQPAVVFHVREQQQQPMFQVLDTLIKIQGLTAIGLPAEDVSHALWIADLSLDALKHWNDIHVDLVVITDRRPHSLARLLKSTSRARYLGDTVHLKIHMEQTADRVTRMLVNGFEWTHGSKTVRHRIIKGGLMPAIVESWYPSSKDNYAVFLEDDVEVSPLFYVWAKYNILRYRYSEDRKEKQQQLYGISLYSPRHLELFPEGRRPFDPVTAIGPEFDPHVPYLTSVPCSWGAVYFPEHWIEFHSYLTVRMADLRQQPDQPLLNITVPGSRSERWKSSWKKYFIELVYLRSYVMLYPNFQKFESFSTNHLEFGTHVKKERTKNALDEFLVPLMQRDTIVSQLPQQHLPAFHKLPVLDLWGNRVTLEYLESVAIDWHRNVSACPRNAGHFDPQDLLCPFIDDNSQQQEYISLASATPLDVSQMDSPIEPDEEMLDIQNDLATLGRLYNAPNFL